MEGKCEYSELTIPNDPAHVDVAGTYAYEIARKFGYGGEACSEIAQAVREAASNVVEHAFGPGEKATFQVSCERVPRGLKVVIRDKGLPFAPEQVPACPAEDLGAATDQPGCGVFRIKHLMDEVSFHNRGRDGKEVHLVKYLPARRIDEYHDVCEMQPVEPGPARKPRADSDLELEIRPMRSSEAVEVAKCFYEAYGYTFVWEDMYYPDRIVELNKSGDLFSAVALTDDNTIVGHAALTRFSQDRQTAEVGLAVVKPEFRRQGGVTRLTRYIIEKAASEGVSALFALVATNHRLSQEVVHRLGFKECGLLVALAPTSLEFRGLTDHLAQRESYLVTVRYLNEPDRLILYPPEHHREFIARLYNNIGLKPDLRAPRGRRGRLPQVPSVVETFHYQPSGYGRITIEEVGKDLLSEVRTRLRELCLLHIEVIQLYVDLSDPMTYFVVPQLEELGFFVGGIRPAGSGADRLIMQYLNNITIDYDRLQIASESAEEIVAYVKSRDPGWNT